MSSQFQKVMLWAMKCFLGTLSTQKRIVYKLEAPAKGTVIGKSLCHCWSQFTACIPIHETMEETTHITWNIFKAKSSPVRKLNVCWLIFITLVKWILWTVVVSFRKCGTSTGIVFAFLALVEQRPNLIYQHTESVLRQTVWALICHSDYVCSCCCCLQNLWS